MATIYHRYQRGDSTFICPQRAPITLEQAAPAARRLSESSERRLSEQRRRSSAVSEKTSMMSGLQSLRAGKLPTNDQLNHVMNRLIYSSTIEDNKKSMSIDGQILLQDFQKLLVALQHALQTKNRDELFQSMIYHVKKSENPVVSNSTSNQAKNDLQHGAKSAYKISKLLLFNSKFRSLLMDIFSVAQQTLGTVIELSGKTISENADTTAASLGENLKKSILISNSTNEMHHPNITTGTETSVDIPVQEQVQLNQTRNMPYTTSTSNSGPKLSFATETGDQFKQRAQDDTKDIGISSKEIITRLKEIFTTIQKNPEYQQAISTIFLLINIWNKRITDTSDERRNSMGTDNYATTAAEEAKAILEDWAQGKSLDPIIEKGYHLSSRIKSDSELFQLQDKVIRL